MAFLAMSNSRVAGIEENAEKRPVSGKNRHRSPEAQVDVQREILAVVARIGPAMTTAIKETVGLSIATVAWHLAKLEKRGDVESHPVRIGGGKTRMEWRITPGRPAAPEPEKPMRPAGFGIDQSDLDWMNKYRARYESRINGRNKAQWS